MNGASPSNNRKKNINKKDINPNTKEVTRNSNIKLSTKLLQLLFKHLTLVNLIVGLIGLITLGLIKYYGIALYIINLFGFTDTEINQYLIAGFFGLITKLGFKGIVEEALKRIG